MQLSNELTVPGVEKFDDELPRRRSPLAAFLRAFVKRRLALLAVAYILTFYVFGVFAPLIAPYGYAGHASDIRTNNVYQAPSARHWFGTDSNGRDLLSRVIYSTRTTLLITVATSLAGGLLIGPVLGLIAGYSRGVADAIINRTGEVLSSIPSLMLLILLAGTLKPRFDTWIRPTYRWPVIGGDLKAGLGDLFFLFLILSAIGWIGDERQIRAQVLSIRETDYVLAARSMGASGKRILNSHVFPNIRYLMVFNITTSLGAVALSEIALSFLGLGVRAPYPSFGQLILEGSGLRNLQAHTYLLVIPGTIAVLYFVAFALLGDALNDVLNPRTR